MGKHNILGKDGEDMAVKYLQDKGYKILERNYRSGRAKIDIIAEDENKIIFVEVKIGSNFSFGYPEVSVSVSKQKLMAKAAGFYMHDKKLDCEVNFDILSIYPDEKKQWEIKHFADAFFPNPADEIDYDEAEEPFA